VAYGQRPDHVAPGAVMAGRKGLAGVVQAVPMRDVAIDGGKEFIASRGAVEVRTSLRVES